jgi:alpha-1,4-galacturonosyltransferase
MGQVLSKAKEELYDCKAITQRLRAMLQSADEQVRSLKKQSTFLSQLAAKTIPNSIHCLSMRLTIDYYLLPIEKRQFPRSENLENPELYHYALFSDNVLAASVVVNSTIMNAKVMVVKIVNFRIQLFFSPSCCIIFFIFLLEIWISFWIMQDLLWIVGLQV